MLPRRLVIYLFVLMQGIAPLMHAHTGNTVHSGVHLPLALMATGDASADTGTQVSTSSPSSFAIGVPTSLDNRLAPHFVGEPMHAPAPWMATRGTSTSTASKPTPGFAPTQGTHHKPPATAPPLA